VNSDSATMAGSSHEAPPRGTSPSKSSEHVDSAEATVDNAARGSWSGSASGRAAMQVKNTFIDVESGSESDEPLFAWSWPSMKRRYLKPKFADDLPCVVAKAPPRPTVRISTCTTDEASARDSAPESEDETADSLRAKQEAAGREAWSTAAQLQLHQAEIALAVQWNNLALLQQQQQRLLLQLHLQQAAPPMGLPLSGAWVAQSAAWHSPIASFPLLNQQPGLVELPAGLGAEQPVDSGSCSNNRTPCRITPDANPREDHVVGHAGSKAPDANAQVAADSGQQTVADSMQRNDGDSPSDSESEEEVESEQVRRCRLGLEPLPSVGSAEHFNGTCRRCCFHPKGRCENGANCTFCHFDHEKRKRKNKKKKKSRRRRTRLIRRWGGWGSDHLDDEDSWESEDGRMADAQRESFVQRQAEINALQRVVALQEATLSAAQSSGGLAWGSGLAYM